MSEEVSSDVRCYRTTSVNVHTCAFVPTSSDRFVLAAVGVLGEMERAWKIHEVQGQSVYPCNDWERGGIEIRIRPYTSLLEYQPTPNTCNDCSQNCLCHAHDESSDGKLHTQHKETPTPTFLPSCCNDFHCKSSFRANCAYAEPTNKKLLVTR